jgi:hypothetical protein
VPLILNQTPRKRKEDVMEIGVMEIEGTLFKGDKIKSKIIGGAEAEVKSSELVINTYLLWFAEVLLIA